MSTKHPYPVRYRAVRQSPFELATYWGDRSRWPARTRRDATVELHELAVVSRLARWLADWAPSLVHDALTRGATPTQVADAAGVDVGTLTQRWLVWAHRQRRLRHTHGPDCGLGMDEAEFDQVCAVLAEPPDTDPGLGP